MSTPVSITNVNTNRLPTLSGQTTLKPSPIHDLTLLQDPRSRTLKRLLQKGHVTVAPLREPNLLLHSHLPHVSQETRRFRSMICSDADGNEQLLGSAYALGADSEQLTKTYEHEIGSLVPIDERFSRGNKIDPASWRDFLGQKPWVLSDLPPMISRRALELFSLTYSS